ncbi:putative outer membrane starch-binding protein [Arcticibacter tournemirensis]|uniref:RagB/SusD family nutrient uptake outer membrane protein n=1 Tax=Arcticibacter tournemirensis TaxID=699437 RepID=A0A5M9HCV8_9SPHI|nr:RagB/SusD family nutrient uptake outer membrane protein [Arcticibacter tournemirensis]KAA8483098.1 RagB/SusD family nutrient uptake outer membrane protein [Arcticibacter tournemirensis]TQM51989.1 putative outer membrane starch-binding protein [Arcticibacter tournemirensis]
MKYYNRFIYSAFTAVTLLASCNKDVLDRPQLTASRDNAYWRNETDIRLYTNAYYANYFTGYNSGFGVDYAPSRGYTFNDDVTRKGVQSNFEIAVPSTRASTSETAAWLTQYAGPTWDFAWVRKSNILIDRLENVAKVNLPGEAYNHWMGVARFFRAFEYTRLVQVFGNVPYFDKDVQETELDLLYKDRDNRGVVMDKVYDDCVFAMQNIRLDDGKQNLNRYIAAAFISRFMLFEGTYEYYHNINTERAKKYLQLAIEASELVMNSGKYSFGSDFKSLFASENLSGNPEVLMYRTYDAALNVTHSVGSYSNGTETVEVDPNLVLIKSFICNDGKVWQNSSVTNANSFSPKDLVVTRDPRFEASFIDKPINASATLLYGYKFASRQAITYIGKPYPSIWTSNTNTNDAPVIRLAEVVLNWIEAKAVLAQHLGGTAVTQADLDKSINAIRNRPLDAEAIAKGVKKTTGLQLDFLPVDPARDSDVPALIWEIRRERRMEFVFEYSRLLDLKRWKKLNYMNFSTNDDYFYGPWVNIATEMPAFLAATYKDNLKVRKADGTVVTYNGTNGSEMVGFYRVQNAANRNTFGDEAYLSPVGQTQINEYKDKGYTLTQTAGW